MPQLPRGTAGTAPLRVGAISVRAFKSFGGAAPSVFTFGSKDMMTCILGPNGCGKSALLEALCFALGAPASTMRVRLLREVVSTESDSQLCEVRVQLMRSRSKAQQHEVATTLSAEGARVFRIDGRVRTAAQLKAFLREGGLMVFETTVIRQAQVTALADANASSALSELVASASGLARWRGESKAAADEVRRARRTLAEVRAGLGKLQAAVAADEQRAQERRHATELQARAGRVLSQLQRDLAEQQVRLECRVRDEDGGDAAAGAAAALAAAQEAVRCAAAEADALAAEVEADRKTVEEGHEDDSQGKPPGSVSIRSYRGTSKWLDEVAVEEQRAAQLQREAAALEALTQSVHATESGLVRHQQAAAAERAALTQRAEHRVRLQSAFEAASAGAHGEVALRQQLGELQQRLGDAEARGRQQQQGLELDEGLLMQLEEEAAAAQREAEQQALLLEQMTWGQDQGLKEKGGDDGSGNLNGLLGSSPGEGGVQQQQQMLAGALERAEHEVLATKQAALVTRADADAAAAGVMGGPYGSGLPVGRGIPGGRAAAKPLAACFAFKHPNDPGVKRLLRALAPVCAASLDVMVVPDAAAAAALLDHHKQQQQQQRAGHQRRTSTNQKLRIWPLDRLAPFDRRGAQREAQRVLGSSRVLLPVDLFDFDPAHEPAMVRAFGGMVIAEDDETAGQLASRFGLGSVTPDGSVSHRGSVAGGWAGPGGGADWAVSRWEALFRRDAAAQAARAAGAAAAAAAGEHARLQRLAEKADRASAARAALAAQVADQQAAAESLQAQAAEARERVQQAKRVISCSDQAAGLHSGLKQCQELLGALEWREQGGAGSGGEKLLQQLQSGLDEARVGEEAAAQRLEEIEAQEDEARAAVEVARLKMAGQPDAADLARRMTHQEQALAAARRRAREREALRAQSLARLEKRQSLLRDLRVRAKSEEEAARKLETQQEEAAQRVREASAAVEEVQRQLRELEGQWGDHPAWVDGARMLREVRGQLAAAKVQKNDTAAAADLDMLDGDAAAEGRTAAANQHHHQQHSSSDDAEGQGGEEEPGRRSASCKHSSAGRAASSKGKQGSSAVGPDTSKRVAAAWRELRQLKVQLSKARPESAGDVAEQAAALARVERVSAIACLVHGLEAEVDALEADLAKGASSVAAANDAVADEVADGFVSMCSSLLPALDVELARLGEQAHEGLLIRFRSRGTTPSTASASHSSSEPWQSDLGCLSGGQRTLVSLALLLAAARAGGPGGGSGLFILDEADAALDEHNQRRIAELLLQLARQGPAQVLCVSHNAAFQAVCDGTVRVTASTAAALAAAAPNKHTPGAKKLSAAAANGTRHGNGVTGGGKHAAGAGAGGSSQHAGGAPGGGGRTAGKRQRVRFAVAE